MGKKKSPKPTAPADQSIHAAVRGSESGIGRKLEELTEAEAVERRKSGLDIVVCGGDRVANRRVAGRIELAAHGKSKCCPPQAGPRSLPHWQPDPRVEGDNGHSFYETDNRKASESK